MGATSASAAIVYTSVTGSIGGSGVKDGPDLITCYNDTVSASGLDGLTGGLRFLDSGACGFDLGGTAGGTLSALTEYGFSLSGSVSAYINDDDLDVYDSIWSNHGIRRRVEFTLDQSTDFMLDMDWTACEGTGCDVPDFGCWALHFSGWVGCVESAEHPGKW